MTDLVVATPVFLDLTFVGLESLPALGEERVAARPAPRTPTTMVMPFGGDRAMVTIDPGARAAAADVAALEPRAVAASLDQLYVVPDLATAYVTCGDDDLRAYEGRPPAALDGAHALFLNQREALGLSGEQTVEDAARSLAERVDTLVVTRAGEGAMAVSNGETVAVLAETIERPIDTTGAGDLLAAAYIWADLSGAELEERLRWAVLYAGLAVCTPTGIGGAVDLETLLREGASRGLIAPPQLTVG